MRDEKMSLTLVAALLISPTEPQKTGYVVEPVPFTDVHLTDQFWAPKIETNRKVSIPFAFQKCEETGRVNLFERAATVLRGEPLENKKAPGYPFDDTDVYKVLEGAAYALSVKPDAKLEAYVDGLIVKIAAAQEPDGYLYCTRTIDPINPHPWAGKQRWELEQHDSHELYNLGHLYEAAVAHYQATGKKTLLNVAIKSADLLDKTFGPGKKKIWPGHEITEMALVKLSKATNEPRYLALAKFLLDCRGGAGEYWQAHKPVVQQTEAVGHAVRASYLYSGMADVAALTGDKSYSKAIDTIWSDVVGKKLYITGGIGATGAGEAFGKAYELPNMSAYCETCAAVGNDYWNQRLFQLHGDGKYVDVLERTLYNGLLSGVSLDGKGFFYPNPLESNGQHARSPWFGVACCPGNITRFMPSLPGYFYGKRGNEIWANLFATSKAEIALDGGQKVTIEQKTEYPWQGDIKFTVTPQKQANLTLNIRIPGWARNEAVPSDLYTFKDSVQGNPTLTVNGKVQTIKVVKGYVAINRSWKKGDVVDLKLPMPIRRIVSNDKVASNRGRVALQRGPIVYCAEWTDNPGIQVRNLILQDNAALNASFEPQLLNGVTVIKGKAHTAQKAEDGKMNVSDHPFTAIPYYAWANRGRGQMMVWLPNSVESARLVASPTISSTAKVKTSGGNGPNAINDGEAPRSVYEESTFFHWWPKKGTTEWVEYEFAKESEVASASIYWFDDTGRGECRTPESWKLFYRDGEDWKPVENPSAYGTELGKMNKVTFTKVKTKGLRLEVKQKQNWASGIYEWSVN